MVFLDRRDIVGDLMTQIDGAYQYALEKMNMGADLGGIVRRDVFEIPEWSVREIITNAVLHRSYIERSPTQLALYADRLEVSSPGGIVRGFTLDRALSGESRPRNEALAQAFLYMGLIESWGSGIPRVRREMAEAGLREPEFLDIDGLLRVNLWRPTADEFSNRLRGVQMAPVGEKPIGTDRKPIEDRLGPMEDRLGPIRDRLGTLEGDKEAKIIGYVQRSGFATASELASYLGISAGYARKLLRGMAKKNIIIKVGDNRYTHYELPKR